MKPCIEWTGTVGNHGYGVLKVLRQQYLAHRWMWQMRRGPIPKGLFVLHRCDNRLCIRIDHLFLGTNLDNVRDMMAKSRQPRGERKSQAKLTNKAVAEI